MKKALFALGLLAVAILPGCGGDNGCTDCRTEVQVKTYNKTAGHTDQSMPEFEESEFDFDDSEL